MASQPRASRLNSAIALFGGMKQTTTYRLRPSMEAVRNTLITLRGDWARSGLPEGLFDRTEQVLAEALNNVVEHAQIDRPQGVIEMVISGGQTGVDVVIRDDGKPMPDLVLPSGEQPAVELLTEEMPEGGFGWFLIRTLADRLDYQRAEGWNHLSIGIFKDEGSDTGQATI